MIINSGFYIPEIHQFLKRELGEKKVEDFYKNQSSFSLQGIMNKLSLETPPLLKVVWNILSRGEATIASQRIQNFLLSKYFPESRISQKSKLNIDLPKLEFKENELELIIGRYNSLTKIDVEGFSADGISLYGYLTSVFKIAQIQKSILMIMLTESPEINIEILGISEDEQQVIVKDLNDYFTHLNALISEGELTAPLVNERPNARIFSLAYNCDRPADFKISKEIPRNDVSLYSKILTDRRIEYAPFGAVKSYEELNNVGEKEEVRTFEYDSEAKKTALLFLLQNLFLNRSFKPGQEAIINRALTGEDVIGLLPTGGGKSLTFQFCALLHPGITIIVDPINSLIRDQHDKLLELGITNSSFINSSLDREERAARRTALSKGQYLLFFISPERLQMADFRQALAICNQMRVYFCHAVIDEAHCVSEWGHDFRHVYLNLGENLRKFCKAHSGQLPIFGLTATASFDVLADVQRELNLSEEAIISLPAAAIDRKELNFSLLEVQGAIPENLPFYSREQQLGKYKYPLLKKWLHYLPSEIESLERKQGFLTAASTFFEALDGEYQNAGVIFCPTKSDKLPNGVMFLKQGDAEGLSGLQELEFLDSTTFFGGEDDDTILTEIVMGGADDAVSNQEKFLKNKANLMIATKAFGMGIDKPNIRYTMHYSFPNSVESFYQEAGRAGRDGRPAFCSILYHPRDIEGNLDFYQNAFKGIERENTILKELLEEVHYEDGFFINVIKRTVREKYPEVHGLSLHIDRNLNIFGEYGNDIRIGSINLDSPHLKDWPKWRKNITFDRGQEITNEVKRILREKAGNQNVKQWLKTKNRDGIKTLIDKDNTKTYSLTIGFTNRVVNDVTTIIKKAGYENFEDKVVRVAYRFCSNADEFLENLKTSFYKFQIKKNIVPIKDLVLDEHTQEQIKRKYIYIRNAPDTQKAIYRLSILKIIDDYTIDYVEKSLTISFKAKSEEEYITNFRLYLRRYLGIESTENWIRKVNEHPEDSILTRVSSVLNEFIESEIAKKRRRSIEYMRDLCEVQIKDGETEFRERMVRYFTSKYARQEYLPHDTENGTIENCAIVAKYLEYIQNPPDGLGGPIDNAKHLRGACDNLRINMTNNASIDLLTAYTIFALELKSEDTLETLVQNHKIRQAQILYSTGFEKLLQNEPWSDVQNLIRLFRKKVLDFNSQIGEQFDIAEKKLLLNRTNFKLKQLLERINHN